LLAVGVNRVVAGNCAAAHAELLALSLAQQAVGSFDLGAAGLPACELVSSAEPCLMCLGATLWSGVRRLVCAAADADVRAIGFDEGPKPPAWADELRRRGIEVVEGVLRPRAVAVLEAYRAAGGTIYNGRAGSV
jgi:tRNA(Arg) A34 adenosine deaminase TadA